jgi:formylmethanofuran--tetrahydromethanopterin N-formyltransferase
MDLHGTRIDDAACELFGLWASRLIVTADDAHWLAAATASAGGYGTSFIGCDAEVAVERQLAPSETPDGRPGAAMLFFNRRQSTLTKAVQNRTGQCLLTCPTTAVFDGLGEARETSLDLGRWVRYFGDGHQYETTHFGRDGWAIPVMSGAFFCEATAGLTHALGGAAVFICGADGSATLDAARRAVEAIAPLPQVITPFPGGVCRAGSKVGSRYRNLVASTNDAYCPTLRGSAKTEMQLHEQVECVYEIVINGLSERAITEAVRTTVTAAAGTGVIEITTGTHGGKLTGRRLNLRQIMQDTPPT